MSRQLRWSWVVLLASACSSATVDIPDVSTASPSDAAAAADRVAPLDAEVLADDASEDSGVVVVDSGVVPVDSGLESDSGVVAADSGVVVADSGALDPDSGALEPDAGGPPCPFTLDSTVTATLRVSADDDRRVLVNEVMVDDLVPSRTWHTVSTRTVTLFRHPARANVIAADVRNYQRIGGYDRGLLLDVSALAGDRLVTDARWRVSTSSAAGWTTAAFDDSAWSTATAQMQHPGGPYGALFGTTTAWWIWLYDSSTAANKPITEGMFARRIFYIQADGSYADAPGVCP